MTSQTPAGGRGSNRAACGCLLVVFLVIASVVGYAVLKGDPSSSSASSSSGSGSYGQAAPSSSAPPSPAQMLADLDGDAGPVSDYQAALDALVPKCTQDETTIASIGNAGYGDLEKNGVKDETRLSVLQHLADSLPAGAPKMDCVGQMAAYVTLREND